MEQHDIPVIQGTLLVTIAEVVLSSQCGRPTQRCSRSISHASTRVTPVGTLRPWRGLAKGGAAGACCALGAGGGSRPAGPPAEAPELVRARLATMAPGYWAAVAFSRRLEAVALGGGRRDVAAVAVGVPAGTASLDGSRWAKWLQQPSDAVTAVRDVRHRG